MAAVYAGFSARREVGERDFVGLLRMIIAITDLVGSLRAKARRAFKPEWPRCSRRWARPSGRS